MIRVVLFLVLVGAAALGAAWVADQSGNVALVLGDWRVQTSLPVFALVLVLLVVVAMMLWAAVRELWRLPRRFGQARRTRKHVRGRQAVTQGLIAIGAGDHRAARRHAQLARRHAPDDPLALLLHAQEAQLSGDRPGAQRAFEAMAAREDTRLLGLRGLFVEAQRSDDPVRAVAIAEATLKSAPNSAWASQAVLGFRCAEGDWAGALAILSSNHQAVLLDSHTFRRERAVLLTAQALELETTNRDRAREIADEAVRLAPTLVPAATLAAKFLSESHQVRKAMRMIEVAWRTHPHPDLADAYAHVRLGDSARERLARVEALAKMAPDGDDAAREAALSIASAAIDARQFDRARSALLPFIAAPTKRVAMLMAEIERGDAGDAGRAREWTLRAVHARHDPVWTADGYVSDRWRPVSPVTGRLDAFRWVTPVAALPSDTKVFDSPVTSPRREPIEAPALAAPVLRDELASGEGTEPAPIEAPRREAPKSEPVKTEAAAVACDHGGDKPSIVRGDIAASPSLTAADAPVVPSKATSTAAAEPASVPPLFRPRRDLGRESDRARASQSIPAVIPMVRAPDDPGVDEDETEEAVHDADESAQAGGWRGFISRVTR